MDLAQTVTLILSLIAFAWVYFYISTKAYLNEAYGDASGNVPPFADVKVQHVKRTDRPYATGMIQNLDDYEYAAVFENEAPRELSDMQRTQLSSQNPMDWTKYPPSAKQFQEGLQDMLDASGNKSPYTDLQDKSLQPPDTSKVEEEERKMLQTYVPKHAGDLTTYDVEDAEKLIKKIYDLKGEIPQVVRKPNNVYEIVGTRRKDEKIVYEDAGEEEAPASMGGVAAAGENKISPPQTASDTHAALDPFYEATSNTHTGKWNYRQWTPGLERMFAPTEARSNWY
jgi:hypothetical protein